MSLPTGRFGLLPDVDSARPRSSILRTMPSGSLSLAQIAAHQSILEVRCTKCDRRGRYRTATLIERYGADFAGPDLREKLSVDCEKHGAAEYERCDLYFPDMLNVS